MILHKYALPFTSYGEDIFDYKKERGLVGKENEEVAGLAGDNEIHIGKWWRKILKFDNG